MARAINGITGSGSVVTYRLSLTDSFRLDAITFVYGTDASPVIRAPHVVFLNPDGSTIARVPDWNDVSANATVTYTFAVSLTPFSCEVSTGGAVQHDLPFAQLEDSCQIVLESVDTAGNVVGGDAFSRIVLWVEDSSGDEPDQGIVAPYTALSYELQDAGGTAVEGVAA